jgi:hypothetical protein
MSLARIQHEMFEVVRTPLTTDETTKPRTVGGASSRKIANSIIAPNDRLSSLERLEIYNRQYWFRILGALMEDFPGLRAVVGERAFERLAIAYLNEHPSKSFTLRNLGRHLEKWLTRHRSYIRGVETLAIEMARLEWAEIEAFDGPEAAVLKIENLAALGRDPHLQLQPYIQLLELSFPIDDLLLSIRRKQDENSFSANAGMKQMRRSCIPRTKLPKPRKIYLAVHRHEFSVYFKRVEPEAFALLREFQRGQKLSQAIEKIRWGKRPPEEVAGQVREWFSNWASLGWFVAPAEKRKKESNA